MQTKQTNKQTNITIEELSHASTLLNKDIAVILGVSYNGPS